MDTLTVVLLSLFLVGVVAAGLTEMVKKIVVIFAFDNKKPSGDDEPKWWTLLNVTMAIVIGALIGLFIPLDMPFDMLVGLSAGILASLLYKQAKRIIRQVKVSTFKKDTYEDDIDEEGI